MVATLEARGLRAAADRSRGVGGGARVGAAGRRRRGGCRWRNGRDGVSITGGLDFGGPNGTVWRRDACCLATYPPLTTTSDGSAHEDDTETRNHIQNRIA